MNINQFLISLKPNKIKRGQERTDALLKYCGNPHKKLNVIQIAGTNGKGSVCAMLDKILRSSGYITGLFTSPHLRKINERIRVNGIAIKDEDIYSFFKKHGRSVIKTDTSFFETLTVLAFLYFQQKQVDIAIMETGLGGRLDSVTVCTPIATGITKIDLDHTHILGSSLEEIAFEKAGIMKKNTPCFTVEQNEKVHRVLKEQSEIKNCSLNVVTNMYNKKISLHGSHQNQNLGLAISIIKSLSNFNIQDNHIKTAVNSLVWYGRYQVLSTSPRIIFDVGHNSGGIKAFLNTFSNEKIIGKKYLLIALQAQKDISTIASKITDSFDTIYCSELKIKNFMPVNDLKNNLNNHKHVVAIPTLKEQFIRNIIKNLNREDAFCIVGSHYFGELISNIFKISFDNL
jgi:dihydrofolate synthase/folylpolyglutamate synthase